MFRKYAAPVESRTILHLQCRFATCMHMNRAAHLIRSIPGIVLLAARVAGMSWSARSRAAGMTLDARPLKTGMPTASDVYFKMKAAQTHDFNIVYLSVSKTCGGFTKKRSQKQWTRFPSDPLDEMDYAKRLTWVIFSVKKDIVTGAARTGMSDLLRELQRFLTANRES